VRHDRSDARLIVAGALSFAADGQQQARTLVSTLGLDGVVEFVGPYTQAQAPGLMHGADLLLHTKYNDPCPTVVLEAMACGLPVVYSASGGVPELVGNDAGAGVPAPLDWERDHPPAPDELAAAVLATVERLAERREAAHARAAEFDSRRWVARHLEVFERLRGT
jgi:glycosyltransferase involved in cell wall biosynthesis